MCAVSNDGSANAWAYPLAEVSRAPSPSEGAQVVDDAKLDEAPEEGGRDDEDRKSRASTPREGTPVEEEGKADDKPDAEGESADTPAAGEPVGEEGSEVKDAVTAPADTTDVEMTDVSTSMEVSTEEPTESDIEMPIASSSQIKSAAMTSPPSRSSAPSRVPTPPPAMTTTTTKQTKVTPLKCLRHTICHSASLLSLSFDPSGKYVLIIYSFAVSADDQVHGDRRSGRYAESVRHSGLDLSEDI